jgi:hypothetical protein
MTTKKGPEALDVEALDGVTGGNGVRNWAASDGSGSEEGNIPGGPLDPGFIPDLAANLPITGFVDRGGDGQQGDGDEGTNGGSDPDTLQGGH